MESDTTRPSRRPTVTAAEKAQAREVSLRRIAPPVRPAPLVRRRRHRDHRRVVGGRRWPRRSCCAPSSTTPCPQQDLTPAGLAGRRHGRRRRRDRRARRRPDLDLARRSASRSCTACAPTSSPTCSASRSRFFTRTRTGEVQSRITNDIGGMQSVVTSTATSIASNLTTAVATAVAMARAVAGGSRWSRCVVLPPVDLADPPGRPDAPRDHRRSSSASWPTSTSPSRRACRSAACCSRKTIGTGPALVERFTASSARLVDLELRSAARRPLADGRR